MTLLPGDVILTGTPAGVGPIVDGDTVSVEIEGIGDADQPGRAGVTEASALRGCGSRRRRRVTRTSAPAYMSLFNLGVRAAARRQVRAAHRGHRPRPAFRGRQRAADLRHAALARPDLGRGARRRWPVRAVPAVRAAGHLPARSSSSCSPTGTPTTAGARQERLAEMREKQRAEKLPTGLRPALPAARPTRSGELLGGCQRHAGRAHAHPRRRAAARSPTSSAARSRRHDRTTR